MFSSFFPKPRIFFPAAILWTALAMALWYGFFRDLGPQLSIGGWVGFPYPPADANGSSIPVQIARDIWLYEYMLVFGAVFVLAIRWLLPQRWSPWSVGVAAAIIFIVWFRVQLDVMLNNYFGGFYNMIQLALSKPNSITAEQFYGQIWTFGGLAAVHVSTTVLMAFVTSHFIFRWRTAMNDYYTVHWARLRRIEGASQRVQEDTMRFAETLEQLGISFLDSVMALIAFLPILWGLSNAVKELPLIGPVDHSLVYVAVLWAAFGTALLAAAGVRLPGIEFRNQRVEAAYRKELVLGEDDANRAQPPTLQHLFRDIRANYFYLYLNFLYFNIARYGYLQASALVGYLAMGPTIIAGGTLTLGILNQTLRAFSRVESSFQFLVTSWSTIVSLISIYKRLKAFEAMMKDKPLDEIEAEVVTP
jgi:peptide/bleomycin uptake transporter